MQIFRGFHHLAQAKVCALTIGNFDGVHRGHQAMLALLQNEARHRGVASCVMTFEPHPRDYFASLYKQPDLAPARIATLRDKLNELAACGVQQCIVLPFNEKFAAQSPDDFINNVLVQGLGVKYVLVGDDFRFGAKRLGDYAMLDAAGAQLGFDVARMNSYEVRGLRVSSSAVREALARGAMEEVAQLLGRPYAISGHVVHGRKLGRELQCPTLNLRFAHWKPAASGIFVVRVHGLHETPLQGVANLGIRPSLDSADVNGGRVLLETHCLDVELLHKLHDELAYDGMDALKQGIHKDCEDARTWFAANT
ncbi:MAG: bifunctional riboflavin kinase/FAD synthetase [Betaproteobacteria bacterium]|nr:bifunctional riboflavin kinase/FAD synthetase [Betaproteobacteria bacterium]